MRNRQGWLAAVFGVLLQASAWQAQAQVQASAQGILDFSYGQFEPSGLYREHRFNSNSMTASFVGGTLKYGFDGGWTTGLNLEAFLRMHELELGRRDGDPILSRNNFAFVQSPYGQLRVGRLQSLLFDSTNRFNAMGNSVPFSPAMKQLFGSGTLIGVQGDFYWSRAIGYSTPSLDGVAAHLIHAQGDGNPLHEPSEGKRTGASLVWQRGLLAAVVSAQRVQGDDGITVPVNESAWQLGASYNFGVARVFGLYTRTKDKGLEVDSQLTSAGAAAPVGPGTLLFQIGIARAEGLAVDRRQTTSSMAYVYPYDSEIDVYLVGMNDQVKGLTVGNSVAVGVRWRFQL